MRQRIHEHEPASSYGDEFESVSAASHDSERASGSQPVADAAHCSNSASEPDVVDDFEALNHNVDYSHDMGEDSVVEDDVGDGYADESAFGSPGDSVDESVAGHMPPSTGYGSDDFEEKIPDVHVTVDDDEDMYADEFEEDVVDEVE